VLRGAKRLLRRCAKHPSGRNPDRGFVFAYLRDRWCGGWYECYFNGVTLASGSASAWARRLHGLPARFEALYLLCKLARANAPGMVCRSVEQAQ
jgi:hypothetical protein